ncbi:AbfB domain-containing protein [Streptomyces mirabilis]|uniref:AbfB domain-containing protein n=1 Tax=Streptomyces mirabilis TaxID=68239 RepID=UPI0036698FC0
MSAECSGPSRHRAARSFAANDPGCYRHQKNNEVWVEKDDGTDAFRNDASFYRRAGLADTASGVSFESYSAAGCYLWHYYYLLYTQPADTTLARADATFYAE